MDILLTHRTAYAYWRSNSDGVVGNGRVCRAVTRRAQAQMRRGEKPRFDHSRACPEACGPPLHVLISDKEARVRSANLISHTWTSPLVESSFIAVDEGYLMSSPEFNFLQMAGSLPLIELIRYGYELCGVYAIVGKEEKLVRRARPLTTVAKLKAFIDRSEAAFGRKRALRALAYVVSGSASPMETALVMMLSLPYTLGGYKLEKPILNHRIDMPRRSTSCFSKRFYVCDLYWPDIQIAVEYDSDQHHTGSERIAGDSDRRNELLTQGVSVITVTRKQLKNNQAFRKIASQLAQELGKRIRCREPEFSAAHFALRSLLLR